MTDYTMPGRDDIAGNPSNATAKAGFGKLWDIVASRLGGGLALSEADRQTTLTQLGLNTLARHNILHNGAMQFDQYNAGALITPATSSFVVDRWGFFVSAASKFTAQQNGGAASCPVGFSNYVRLTSSGTYSPVSSDEISLAQGVVSNDISRLGWGTSQAQAAVLSFWVRSSLTGSFGASITNYAKTRSYPFVYTITSANTWQLITVAIPADTTGTWVKNSKAGGAILFFDIGTGSTYKGSAGAWATANYQSATGSRALVATNGATLDITAVQLTAGTLPTAFEHPQFSENLRICQGFFSKSFPLGVVPANGLPSYAFSAALSASDYQTLPLPATMRAIPTVVKYGDGAGNWTCGNPAGAVYIVPMPVNESTIRVHQGYTGATLGGLSGNWTASAELI